MELTEARYERIAPLLLVQRGNVRGSNLQVFSVILYVAEYVVAADARTAVTFSLPPGGP